MTKRERAPRIPRRYGVEVLLLLGVSLGQSAVYSVLSIAEKLTRPVPLAQQTTTMNTSVTPDRPWLDLSYQIAGIVFPLVPALLALYLLHLSHGRARTLIGFDLAQPGRDLLRGFAVAAGVGIPGLALYVAARELGINTTVAPANLAANWWTVPVLIALAAMNGILEEVVMLGYLFVRFADRGWRTAVVVGVSALIRASYHLYQGFGGFGANLAMGVLFGVLYLRWKRVLPLVIAHTVLDIVAFVGYALAKPYISWL